MQLITKRNGFTFCVVNARTYGFDNAVATGMFDQVILVTDRGKVLRKFVKRAV
jgi:hypothetical protein